MGKFIDLTGQKFGRLVAMKRVSNNNFNKTQYICLCDCGNKIVVNGNSLKSGNTKSCGCLALEIRLKNLSLHKLKDNEANFNAILNGYKRRDKNFSLSKEKFEELINEKCFYCGAEPHQIYNGHYKKRGRGYVYNGIDRLNNEIGYTEENCVPCCKECNFAKHVRNKDEFLFWIERVYKHSILKIE